MFYYHLNACDGDYLVKSSYAVKSTKEAWREIMKQHNGGYVNYIEEISAIQFNLCRLNKKVFKKVIKTS